MGFYGEPSPVKYKHICESYITLLIYSLIYSLDRTWYSLYFHLYVNETFYISILFETCEKGGRKDKNRSRDD